MTTSVRYYDSTMPGAPSLSGTAGTLISVLDACLVNGFGSVTINPLVVASNVATATVSGGHGFAMVGSTGPVVRIEGATPAGLNGDWRITVTSATQFTFATTGITDQTATGTISVKRAPAGFSKAFSGTNKEVYRADDIASTRLYLRVADDGTGSAAYARCVGYESMSDVDTGVNAFPTAAQLSGGGYWHKSSGANATVRNWMIVADSAALVMLAVSDGTKINPVSFGDIATLKAADAFHCGLWAANTTAVDSIGVGLFASSSSKFAMARDYSQLGTSILPLQYSHSRQASYAGQAGAGYLNPADNSFLVCPIEVWDSTTVVHGFVAGLYSPVHASASLTDQAVIAMTAGPLVGRDVMIRKINIGGSGNNGAIAIDLTGPWR